MTDLTGDQPPGSTPLDQDDVDGLIPTFVTTRGELNLVEQANIERATLWAFRSRRVASRDTVTSINFVDRVHREMFGEVWTWAGKRRTRETNIGVDPILISEELRKLMDDLRYWAAHDTFNPIGRAVRFHHQLVSIHPYRNGNGRHARFVADLYLHANGEPRLSWGASDDLTEMSSARARYIAALRAADGGTLGPLLEFAIH